MKRGATLLVLLTALAGGAVHALDLLYATDPATGFVTAGPLWGRYAALWGILLLCLLAAQLLAPRQPAVLQCRSLPMGLAGLLAGAAFAAAAGAGWMQGGAGLEKLLVLLQLCGAVWLLASAFKRMSSWSAAPTASAVWGILASLSLYLFTMMRFGSKPSGLVRMAPTVGVLSALMGLLFFTALVRASYLPEADCGRSLYFTGTGAFFLCTCMEFPQTLILGRCTIAQLLSSAALAVLGLLGAVCALTLCRPEPEP